MKILKLLFLVGALSLTGCAQWQAMTPQQQQLVIGTAVVSLVVGYHANSDDVTVINNEIPIRCDRHHC